MADSFFSPAVVFTESQRKLDRAVAVVYEILWLCLFAGTPLFFFPWAYESYAQPKFEWVKALVVGILCLRAAWLALGRPLRIAFHSALLCFVAWGVWHAVAAFWARSPSLAWESARFWLLMGAAAVLFADFYHRNRAALWRLGAALVAAAAITAAWALTEDYVNAFAPQSTWVGNRLGDWRGSIAAGFGNTSHIGDFLALLYPFVFVLFLDARRRVMKAALFAALLAMYAALIVVFSVHSNAGLILGMAVMLVLLIRRRGLRALRLRARRLAILIAGWVAIALFFSFDTPGNPHRPGIFVQALSSDRLEFGIESRQFIWLTALDMIRGNTWLGVGPANFPFVFPETHSDLIMSDPRYAQYAGKWTNAAHNELLQAWAEMGIAGAALLALTVAMLLVQFGRRAPSEPRWQRRARLAALAGVIAFCVHAQMNFPLELATGALWLALWAGLAAALAPEIARALRLPDICLDYDWGRLAVELASFKRPAALRLEPRALPRVIGVPILILLLLPLGWQSWVAARRLRSGVEFRSAAQARDEGYALSMAHADSARIAEALDRADAHFRETLRLWPNHQDARSAYSAMLVSRGQGAEAVGQVQVALERLNAWELYLRGSAARWLAGNDEEEARALARRAFTIRPIEAVGRPQVARWAREAAPLNAEAGRREFEAVLPR